MLRRSSFSLQAAVGRFGVSPYAVFLMKNKGNKELVAPSIEERGRKCAAAWYAIPDEERKGMQGEASRMPVFPQRRFAHPRCPPPFGRFVQSQWHTTSERLTFEDRVQLLAKRYQLATGTHVLSRVSKRK